MLQHVWQAGLCSFNCLLSPLKATERFSVALGFCMEHRIDSIDSVAVSEAQMSAHVA